MLFGRQNRLRNIKVRRRGFWERDLGMQPCQLQGTRDGVLRMCASWGEREIKSSAEVCVFPSCLQVTVTGLEKLLVGGEWERRDACLVYYPKRQPPLSLQLCSLVMHLVSIVSML